MARLRFPDSASIDRVQATAGSALLSASGATARVYLDEAGTQLADILNADGSANATATLILDNESRLPEWDGPDAGQDQLWVRIDGGAPLLVEATLAQRFAAQNLVVTEQLADQDAAVAAQLATQNSTVTDQLADQDAAVAAQIAINEASIDTKTATHAASAIAERWFAQAFPAPTAGPVITVTGPGGATSVPAPTVLPYDTALVTRIGCVPILVNQLSTDYHRNSVNGDWTAPMWAIEFDTSSADFDLRFRHGASSGFWVWVDGRPTTRQPHTVTTNVGGGSRSYYRMTFPDARPRRIRIYLMGNDFGGLDIANGGTVTPTVPEGKRGLILGDSWTEGTNATGAGQPWTMGWLLGHLLGWQTFLAGQGGSGYTQAGGATNKHAFADPVRLADVVTAAPDFIVIQGSSNDRNADPAVLQAAAASTYDYLNTNLPAARIVVLGPQQASTPIEASRLTARDATRAAALAAPNVVGFVDMIDPPWIFGTGRVNARTGDGNADYLRGTDAAHPSRAGAHELATRAALEVYTALVGAGLTP